MMRNRLCLLIAGSLAAGLVATTVRVLALPTDPPRSVGTSAHVPAAPATSPGVTGSKADVAAATPALPPVVTPFLQRHCVECHDPETKEGGLDLTALKFDPSDAKATAAWVKVHDRVWAGEMPPPKKAKGGEKKDDSGTKNADAKDGDANAAGKPPVAVLSEAERDELIWPLAKALQAGDDARTTREGRATQRRLNRYEYENAVRDLLHAPWLQIRDGLPEDGEANRFNKVGEALDVSHVQLARYLNVADYALQQVIGGSATRPTTTTTRYHTRDQKSFTGKMTFTVFNTSPERATFPVFGFEAQPDVRAGKAPITVGKADPEGREKEAVGVIASTYEPLEIRFNKFEAPTAGHYKLRFKTYSVWVGPGKGKRWDVGDLDTVSKGRRDEPITVYAETQPRLLRRLGAFDAHPDPQIAEIDTYLLAGETIRPDAARLFRSRPPNWHNPLAEKDGTPGVAFAWLEVEGPILDDGWPTAGQKVLLGDLPMKAAGNGTANPAVDGTGAAVAVESKDPAQDADRLLRAFMTKAYRRPVVDEDVARFRKVIDASLATGGSFVDAMTAGYTAVLCSPGFVCVDEQPGKLDDYALATRLSLFLWNTAPDDELRKLAAAGELHKPEVLKQQTDRLLADPRSRQFVDAFLDYWLDLRKVNNTSADEHLYPDYYLDDLLTESADEETRAFFAELVAGNRPAKDLVAADFAMLNERLATHYGIPGVQGVGIRKVQLPPNSPRGGLLTQASVLKVTSNGTTTSPVTRGVWVMERILGAPPPPPPPTVPAVEPDIRGATTIRQQLDKHRSLASCSACHAKIDPAGFALESFDVMGGWRTNYRALGETATAVVSAKLGEKAADKVAGKPATKPSDKVAAKPEATAKAETKPEKKPEAPTNTMASTDRPNGTFGKNGQPFKFTDGPVVDSSGTLPDGRSFHDVVELKKALAAGDRQPARNLVRQLVVYGTGGPIRFGDRAKIEAILDQTKDNHYGVRDLIHAVVASELFLNK